MMRIFFSVFVVLCLFSCKKDDKVETMDFSLLKQYNWKSIIEKETEDSFDPDKKMIKYADTAMYSFGETSFNYYSQYAVIGGIIGSGGSKIVISYSKLKREGSFKLNAADSTFQITYKQISFFDPKWGVGDPIEEIVSVKYKILSLDKSSLKLSKTGVPCFECNEEVYFSVSK